jgi:nucleoside 2-deoxyribosyltransferase
MKIYFTQSSRLPVAVFKQIESQCGFMGHVLTYRARSEDRGEATKESCTKAFIENHNKILSADIVVAECSYHSNGLGFELAYALEHSVPVIALYNIKEDTENQFHINHIITSIAGNTSRFILPREYTSKTLSDVLKGALESAAELTDSKFNLIIPFKINRFLDWAAKKKGKTKSEVTREAIELLMKNNSEYKEYFENGREG